MNPRVSFFLLLLLALYVRSESSCRHENRPKSSTCTGCPPRDKETGKLCASTTRYNDLTKGACGCGTEPNPKSYWSKSMYTAALNAKNLDPGNPTLGWCPQNCGGCFRLCSTGGTTVGKTTERGKCITVRVENRCGDGYKEPGQAQWCRQEMSFQECLGNPGRCEQQRMTNDFGYPAHFDLQDANLQITNKLGWDNVEVTFEPVQCPDSFPMWQRECQCRLGPSQGSIPAAPRSPAAPSNPRPAPRPAAPRPPPPPSPRPPAAPANSGCGVKYGGQADNQWYLDLIAPQGSNVQVQCGGGSVVSLTYQPWGRFTWSSTGGAACPNPRVAIVNGRRCSISNAFADSEEEDLSLFEDTMLAGDLAVADENSEFSEFTEEGDSDFSADFAVAEDDFVADTNFDAEFSDSDFAVDGDTDYAAEFSFADFAVADNSNSFSGATSTESTPGWAVALLVVFAVALVAVIGIAHLLTTKLRRSE